MSDAVKHIVEWKAGVPRSISNYLDDYLFVAFTLRLCNRLVKIFLDFCQEVGIPVATEKTVWVTRVIVFLGILLDGGCFILSLPVEKRVNAINLLNELTVKRKVTVRRLQRLAGVLNFLSRAIYTGRAFTRRIYVKCTGNKNLKPHHHIWLDQEFKSDCSVWL